MLKKHQFRLFVGSTMKLSLCAVSAYPSPGSLQSPLFLLFMPSSTFDGLGSLRSHPLCSASLFLTSRP